MHRKPAWQKEGQDWPNRAWSRFVQAGGLRWHVQDSAAGAGPAIPVIALIHGTGAATHSWAGVAPLLARRARVIAMDLPGHGFTGTPHGAGLSLPGMARLLGRLFEALDVRPVMLVGHSAGAALACQLSLEGLTRPSVVVAVNGAFEPFGGMAAHVFPAIAQALALNPVSIGLMAAGGRDPERVRKLIEGTGSRPPDDILRHYRALFAASGHIAGVMGMMARWNLAPLARRLPELSPRLVLIASEGDKAVPARVSREVADKVAGSRYELLKGYGHLVHEEDPDTVARIILEALEEGAAAPPAATRRAAG